MSLKNKIVFVITLLIFTSCASKKKTEGQQLIENFYKTYFESLSAPTKPNLTLSKELSEIIAKNRLVCKAKAGSDICGWDAMHGDDYLNAQEIDSDLTYENSKFKSSESKPNIVRVEFNVMPSEKTHKQVYFRVIEYVLVNEGLQWVVDDVVTEGKKSIKQTLINEMDYYNSQSTSDSNSTHSTDSTNNQDERSNNSIKNKNQNKKSRFQKKNNSTRSGKAKSGKAQAPVNE